MNEPRQPDEPPGWHKVVGSGWLGRAAGVPPPELTPPPDGWQPRPGPPSAARSSGLHTLLKWALALWAIGYAVLSCSPMLISGSDTGTSIAAGGIASLIVGATLFGPWIVGVIVLAILVWVTK